MSRSRYTVILIILCTIGSVASAGSRITAPQQINQPGLVDAERYIDRIIESLESQVLEYGINNLPVEDALMTVSRTVYGVNLHGSVLYYSGVVMATERWKRFTRYFQTGAGNETAYIISIMKMPNITVFYNFYANLTVGESRGTALHLFPTNHVSIYLKFNVTSRSVKVEYVRPDAISGPLTEYCPATNVSLAVARVARLTSSTVLWEDITKWITEIFTPMLTSIVTAMPVPLPEPHETNSQEELHTLASEVTSQNESAAHNTRRFQIIHHQYHSQE